MARNGIWELREVLLRYCASSGSSRGVRDFVERDLVSFATKNPQVQFQTKIQGGHPCVFAKYVTGYERQRSLKNMSAEEVEQVFQLLRDTLGRRVPAHNEFGTGVVEKTAVSVQGVWRNRPHFVLPETHETLELRERRHRDYSVEKVVDQFGLEGFVRMTQKLLDQREKAHLAALDRMPKKERVMPTE